MHPVSSLLSTHIGTYGSLKISVHLAPTTVQPVSAGGFMPILASTTSTHQGLNHNQTTTVAGNHALHGPCVRGNKVHDSNANRLVGGSLLR